MKVVLLQDVKGLGKKGELVTASDGYARTVRIKAKAGSNGKLFGSVTGKDIAEAINSQFGFAVDKKKVQVEDIKAFGTYPAEIRLYNGISASIYVLVGE